MQRLDINNGLFQSLVKTPPRWWMNLKSDKDLYFEIRKENYIDVYYNGANIITKLRFDGKYYTGSIHYKYLIDHSSPYIKYDFKDQVALKTESINLISLDSFSPEVLKRIKRNIKVYFPCTSEKGIQAAYIKHSGAFLDSEFAYTLDESLRIDLIWIDTVSHLIIPVELKTIGDSRLFNGKISLQLKKYCEFLTAKENELRDFYAKLFEIKKLLNILPAKITMLKSLDYFTLIKKPLLLFGDCEQSWIDKNVNLINQRIRDYSTGAYYFGRPGYDCNLLQKTSINRHVWTEI